jgi:hypothetical protein
MNHRNEGRIYEMLKERREALQLSGNSDGLIHRISQVRMSAEQNL